MTSNKQTRIARQEKARAAREAQIKAERATRRRWVAFGVSAALVVVAGIGIGIGMSGGGGTGGARPPAAVTTGTKIAKGGMAIGQASAPVTMDAYEDFTCPICGEFESTTGSTVVKLVKNGTLRVRYHMMSFIDDNNGGTYSHRAANAFAAADAYGSADKALALHSVLYAHQPSETSKAGLSDAQILKYAASVGLTSSKFVNAVKTMEFKGWVNTVADDASKAGVNSTPTIYLNGKNIDTSTLLNSGKTAFDPAQFTKAVDAAKAAAKP